MRTLKQSLTVVLRSYCWKDEVCCESRGMTLIRLHCPLRTRENLSPSAPKGHCFQPVSRKKFLDLEDEKPGNCTSFGRKISPEALLLAYKACMLVVEAILLVARRMNSFAFWVKEVHLRNISFPFDLSDGNDIRFQLPSHVVFRLELLPSSLCRSL